LRCLNLGCGEHFHPDWTNLDFRSSGPGVVKCDLRQGIPAGDATFDVVYLSHLLEHFDRQAGFALLRECRRVLRSGGTVRVAVPDLERIARTYLELLHRALRGEAESIEQYEWIMLELYDQTVRERSGGAMLDYFKQRPLPAEDFVIARIGAEARKAINALQKDGKAEVGYLPWYRRAVLKMREAVRQTRARLLSIAIGPADLQALKIGRFRGSGEVHQWMYDRYSLGRALEQAGFRRPVVRAAHESSIPNWSGYCLDTEPDGSVYKPDSLYIEAVKP
jgi:predicted SAM-dependent methyltransferase